MAPSILVGSTSFVGSNNTLFNVIKSRFGLHDFNDVNTLKMMLDLVPGL